MTDNLLSAVKIIAAPNELLAIFSANPEEYKDLLQGQSEDGYTVIATEYGIQIQFFVAKLTIDIPFLLFDHLIQWPNVVLFFAREEDYIPVALYTITLDKSIIDSAKEILSS